MPAKLLQGEGWIREKQQDQAASESGKKAHTALQEAKIEEAAV